MAHKHLVTAKSGVELRCLQSSPQLRSLKFCPAQSIPVLLSRQGLDPLRLNPFGTRKLLQEGGSATMGSEEKVDMMEVDVAIVGGGMAGLALALGLQDRGIHAHVFEKAPEVRPHFGTGTAVGRNGMRALDGIKQGLGEKLEKVGSSVEKVTSVVRTQGHMEEQLPLSSTDTPRASITIPWKRAHQTLMDELLTLQPYLLHWSHAFVDYRIVQGGVAEARFKVGGSQDEGHNSTMKVVRTKLIVGADGIWSQVRKQMVGDAPRDLCMITWNSLVPTDSIRSLNLHENNELRQISYADRKFNIVCMDTGLGSSLVQVRVPDKSGEITRAYASDVEAHGREARKVRVLRQIEGIQELQNLRIAIEGIEPDSIREGGNFDRLPLSSWSHPSGHVLLIGDAAHAMYPRPGQGAGTAYEDAHQLSVLLHKAFSTGSSALETAVPDAVRRFEEVRIPRVTRISNFAAEMTTWPEFIPEWVQKLPPVEQTKRFVEILRWVTKYPEAMTGDPDSTYWKP